MARRLHDDGGTMKFINKQSDKCIFGGSCCYPIDDCQNCPARPENGDPYWGLTQSTISASGGKGEEDGEIN